MADQFEAEKCLHAASTDNLVLTIIDNRSDPRAAPRQPSGNSDGTNPGTWAKSRCKTTEVFREGMLALGIDRCINMIERLETNGISHFLSFYNDFLP